MDLRMMYLPPSPAVKKASLGKRLASPRSPHVWPIMKFVPPHADHRTNQWKWWEALAEVDIKVIDYYAFTKYAAAADWGNSRDEFLGYCVVAPKRQSALHAKRFVRAPTQIDGCVPAMAPAIGPWYLLGSASA